METLFLKYRPQCFGDLVGQETMCRTLRNALKANKAAHAYLFAGKRGTGKTSAARILAKGLNCQQLQDGDPCSQCDICVGIANGRLIDIVEIDGASNRGIDEIRSLREKIKFAPTQLSCKVYIIDEVHMLTKDAFNALLKTLEEPPVHSFFCLATTELNKIPPTIISRCQTFTFTNVDNPDASSRLETIITQEKITIEPKATELILDFAEGSMRDAISLLEQMNIEHEGQITLEKIRQSLGLADPEMLEQFWQSLQQDDASQALALLRNFGEKGRDWRFFGHSFLRFLRQQMHDSLEKKTSSGLAFIMQAIEEISLAVNNLKHTPLPELPMEIAVINLTNARQTEAQPSLPASIKTPPVAPPPASSVASSQSAEKFSDPKASISVPTPTDKAKSDGVVSAADLSSCLIKLAEIANLPASSKQSLLVMKPTLTDTELILTSKSRFHHNQLRNTTSPRALNMAASQLFAKELKVQLVIDEKETDSEITDSGFSFDNQDW